VFRYRQALENGGEQTDDLAVLQAAGMAVTTIPGDPDAFKITHPADWDRAETLARRERALSGDYDLAGSVMPETRTGLGYDVHRFSLEPDRPMMLGGVFFQDVTGLDGHSDADVVLHAVVDALLGAAALGDIGMHFPPSDPKWHNAPSIKFLDFAVNEIRRLNWRIVHLDIAVIAESPKIMPRAIEIRTTIAEAAGITLDRVSIKATTNERMGFVGRGEGIACHAVATISRP
jgi:2-C-methyl-D-erythritol 4-phosphate cytidylyltransferase/2-C-methyl-D-erythritol 2,4-cyclodiphosphate synthase